MLWRCLRVWVSLWKSLCHFPLNFLAQDLPPNLKLIYLAQPDGQEASAILLLPFSQHWGYRYTLPHLDFHVDARDTNSCPHVLSHAHCWLSHIPSLAILLLSKTFHHPNGEPCTLSVLYISALEITTWENRNKTFQVVKTDQIYLSTLLTWVLCPCSWHIWSPAPRINCGSMEAPSCTHFCALAYIHGMFLKTFACNVLINESPAVFLL